MGDFKTLVKLLVAHDDMTLTALTQTFASGQVEDRFVFDFGTNAASGTGNRTVLDVRGATAQAPIAEGVEVGLFGRDDGGDVFDRLDDGDFFRDATGEIIDTGGRIDDFLL